MFTGIITHCGEVVTVEATALDRKIWFVTAFTDLQLGESIALDGICLTVTEINGQQFRSDVSPETLRLTTAKRWQPGIKVNQERALRLVDRMGGHFVFGHIDQMGMVVAKEQRGDYLYLEFSNVLPENQMLLVKKGSVAINGVSLTVNHVNAANFSVLLIPHTLEQTNLNALTVSDSCNIEFDLLAKYIISQTQQREQREIYV